MMTSMEDTSTTKLGRLIDYRWKYPKQQGQRIKVKQHQSFEQQVPDTQQQHGKQIMNDLKKETH